jgi:hypothetical protein
MKPIRRDGFLILQNAFLIAPNADELAPHLKTNNAICDLFVNQELSIKEIAKTVRQPSKRVIYALIKQGIVQERRSSR